MQRRTLLLIIFISLVIVGFIGCESQESTGATEQLEKLEKRSTAYRALLKREVQQFFSQKKDMVQMRAEGVARKLKQNRPFMLAYFLDQSRNSSVVKDAAAQNKACVGVDYILLSDSIGEYFSAFGGGRPEEVFPEKPGYWLTPSHELHIFGRSSLEYGKIGVITGTLVDQSKLDSLKKRLGIDIVIQYKNKPLLSTLDGSAPVAFIEEGALINGDTLLTEEIKISEEIGVILFIE